MKLVTDSARQFLLAIYRPFYSQNQKKPAYIEVRGKREGEGMSFRRFYRNPEILLKDMVNWNPDLNYWVGVALRKDNKGGKKENLLALTTAFCDVDCSSVGHKNAPKYQTKPEALAAIKAFPLRPSMLIDSGGGYQGYWFFRDPVPLSEAEIARLERINRGVARAIGGDIPATDAARILRLAGTFNMKLAGHPRPVKVIWCEPERLYDLGAFARYEAQGPAKNQGCRQAHHDNSPREAGGDHAAYAQKALANELAKLAGTPEGSHNRNNQLNKSAKALGELVGARVLDRVAVEAGLMGAARSISLSEKEARATIRSGLEAGIKEPRKLPEKQTKASKLKDNGVNDGGPTGPEDEEPEKIYWVGHYYFTERGRHCLETYDRQGIPQTRPLTNFTARITDDISRDDGQQVRREFHIEGLLDSGGALPIIKVPAGKFDSLSWLREWGATVSVAPGTSLRPHVANAISALSHAAGIKRSTVYAKTGWQQIKGVWRYLHGAGAIGPGESIEVDLGENLHLYRLPPPGGLEAAQASLRFLDVAPWEVTAPLFAAVYLAPFADLLKIDFSLWLYGPTGSMKSTLAALALCHFGQFSRTTLPGSWFSTANSLERLCFTLADTLIVIDDFCPAASAKDFTLMAERAGRLIFQAGNRSGRGRLAPDLSARPNYYPRGLIVSTGEMLLPGQRQSATARYLGIELDPKKTPVNKALLTAAQDKAAFYAGAMAAYLEDLAPKLREEQALMRTLFESYRGVFQNGGHARIPEIEAWLVVGFEMAMRFFVGIKAVSQEEAKRMLNQAWNVFEALGRKHSRIISGEAPTQKFLEVLNELFLTSRIYCESAGSSALSKGAKPPKEHLLGWTGNDTQNAYPVGYADETTCYLLPNAVYKAVAEAVRAQGDYLSLSKNEMLSALAREGLIEVGGDGRHTHVKWILGGAKRVFCLPRRVLGHNEVMEGERA